MEGFGEIITQKEMITYFKIGQFIFYKITRDIKSISSRVRNPKRKYWGVPILDTGMDLRYTHGLLRYKDSKTTKIYTHVSTKNLSTIKNLLNNRLKGCET